MNAAVQERAASVLARLQYLEPGSEKPRSLEFEPPPGVPHTTAVYRERAVSIQDMRPIATYLSLDREGFRLLTAPSSVWDFRDENLIRARYYPEAVALIRRVAGAARVVVFDHTIRRRVPGALDRARGIPRQPVPRVHNDYTSESGPQRVRDLLAEEADELLRRRFCVLNLWRPLKGPVEDSPLGLADARTVKPSDLIATDLIYPDRRGEIYYVRFNPAHRWYYAPAMGTDEVLLFKCFDSARDGRARFVPHSAFTDPNTAAGAAPRESIELRTLVFFDEPA
ncbi:MAG TPA: CmcJ/NvfI family oxidoreductase [Steroidobacteraceae bacterium]|nr:CmcJ/NvfI family oxidoreductase [Steroidobacteraceae bacterium]